MIATLYYLSGPEPAIFEWSGHSYHICCEEAVICGEATHGQVVGHKGQVWEEDVPLLFWQKLLVFLVLQVVYIFMYAYTSSNRLWWSKLENNIMILKNFAKIISSFDLSLSQSLATSTRIKKISAIFVNMQSHLVIQLSLAHSSVVVSACQPWSALVSLVVVDQL